MKKNFHKKTMYIFSLLSAVSLLSACSGINVRLFPESIKESADASAELTYEATKCIPLVSCSYHFSILGSGNWAMYEQKIVVKPDYITKQYVEFTNIKSSLNTPGNYVLRSIELKYGDYSHFLTGKDEHIYKSDSKENIQYENKLKSTFNLNLYSFISYNDIRSKVEVSLNNVTADKVPIRIGHDPSMYPSGGKRSSMDIPLPFSRIDKIEFYYTDNIFFRPDSDLANEIIRANYNRGISFTKSQNYPLAINSFTEAIKLNPDFVEAYYGRGYVYDESGSYQQAIDDYTKVIEIQPDNPEAYYNRGNSFSHLNEQQKAVDDYTMAIKHKPDHASAYFNRGNSYSNLCIYQKAIDDFTVAIKFRPDDSGIYFNRGSVYDVTGNSELADRDFAKAIELNPELKNKHIKKPQATN